MKRKHYRKRRLGFDLSKGNSKQMAFRVIILKYNQHDKLIGSQAHSFQNEL